MAVTLPESVIRAPEREPVPLTSVDGFATWHLKVSPESEKNGAVKGWVDGKLRWRYENIATIQSGSYVSLSINPTFNQQIEGPRQRRYWDLISMGSGYMR